MGAHWSIVSGVPLTLTLLIHLWNHCVKCSKYRTNVDWCSHCARNVCLNWYYNLFVESSWVWSFIPRQRKQSQLSVFHGEKSFKEGHGKYSSILLLIYPSIHHKYPQMLNQWKCLSVQVPPLFPHCTVLLTKSPSFCYGLRDTHKWSRPTPKPKFKVMGQTVWLWECGHTHSFDSVTSTADAGGKKANRSITGSGNHHKSWKINQNPVPQPLRFILMICAHSLRKKKHQWINTLKWCCHFHFLFRYLCRMQKYCCRMLYQRTKSFWLSYQISSHEHGCNYVLVSFLFKAKE